MEHDESKQQPDGDSTSTVQPAYTMEQLQAPASLLPGVLNRFGLGDVRFSEQTSSDVLLAALSDASWTVRVAALRALAQRDVHAFLPPLLMAASDENAFVRAAALQPLGTIADPAALAALLQALQDPQWNVRLMAARSLGRYGTDVPLDVLVDVLDDEHELVREAAKLALKQVNQQPSRSEAAMAAVVDDDDQQHQDILPIQDMQDELAHTDMNQSRDKKTIYERYPLPLKESKNMSDNDDFQNQLPEQDNFNSDNSQPTLISNVRRPVGRRRLKPWNLIAAAAAILFVLFNGVIWFALSSQQAASHYTVGKRNVLSVTPATRVPATPLPAHTPTAAATPTPTASPAVTPAPIASPTPSPAVSPTPVPSPQPTATPQPHVYVPATTSCNASPQSGNPGSTAIVTPTPTQGTTPPVGTILVTYSGHSNGIAAVAWSPDGKRIATGSWDATVQVWDASSGTRQTIYRGHHTDIADVAWSPDSTLIASTDSFGDTMQIWNAATGTTLYTCTQQINDPGSFVQHYTGAVAWSPDGTHVAFSSSADGSVDNQIQILDLSTHKLTVSVHPSNFVMDLAWSPDSQRLAYGSYDGKVYVLNASTGVVQLTYVGHSASVLAVAWSPDGKYIASGAMDQTVQVWSATTAATVYTYRGHTAEVDAVAWSPDGRRIASAGAQTVQVWDALSGANAYIYGKHTQWVRDLAWSPDSTRIVSVSGGNATGEVEVWQAA